MEPSALYGVIPPIVTPFDAAEQLDEAALREEVNILLAAGVHGISFGGSTGEGALLSDEELARGIRTVQGENNRSVPVLCGIIRNSLRDAIRAGLAAREAGADVLMVTPTYYHGTSAEGNIRYFAEIAQAVELPIVIYNVIKNNPVEPETMRKLADIPGILGIKQSVGGIHGLTDMIAACGDRTRVYGAQDDLMYISYELGAVGAISAILSLFPSLCVEQWNAVQRGDYVEARRIHYRMLPVWRLIEGGTFPGKIKAAIELTGRRVGVARQPIQPLAGRELELLAQAMRDSQLI